MSGHPSPVRIAPGAQQRGISLVEMMVALVIGLVVAGVGITSYLNVQASSRNANLLAQMNEDANTALTLIRSQVLLAGYSRPLSVQTGSVQINGTATDVSLITRAYSPSAAAGGANNFIVGCDGGFSNARSNELQIAQLACNAAASGSTLNGNPDAIAIVYEANTSNTYPNSTNVPTDCLGNDLPPRYVDASGQLTAQAGSAATVYLASNKFYVATGSNGKRELYCLGNGRNVISTTDDTLPSSGTGSVTPQPLVENVIDLQILYGIAGTTTTGSTTSVQRDAVAYVNATDLRRLTGTDKWNRVVSVRICVVVQSANTISTTEQTKYVDCNGTVSNPPDSTRLVRSYTTTVVLHNRINRL